MTRDDRKAAKAAYKERKTVAGIYAVRCRLSGQIWVGQAPDVDTMQNRLWFTLRFGNDPHRSLQAAWTTHGADSFTFEILERLKEEDLPYIRQDLLKGQLAHWQAKLEATSI
jgi:hypothetical protein